MPLVRRQGCWDCPWSCKACQARNRLVLRCYPAAEIDRSQQHSDFPDDTRRSRGPAGVCLSGLRSSAANNSCSAFCGSLSPSKRKPKLPVRLYDFSWSVLLERQFHIPAWLSRDDCCWCKTPKCSVPRKVRYELGCCLEVRHSKIGPAISMSAARDYLRLLRSDP